MPACKSTKTLKEGEVLLARNKKSKFVDDKENSLPVEDYVLHRPNKKVLGFMRLYLSFYNLGTTTNPKKLHKNDSSGIRKFLREKLGEPPVIFDSSKVDKSARNIENFLVSQGYFNAQVVPQIKFKRKNKKAVVRYQIIKSKPFTYDTVISNIEDKSLEYEIEQNYKYLSHAGQNINFDVLELERNKLTQFLRNKGYFYFNKDLIYFELDTLEKTNSAKLIRHVLNPPGSKHYKCIIGKVTVYVNGEVADNHDSLQNQKVDYILNGYRIHPEVLSKYSYIKPNQHFKMSNEEKTYAGLASLNLFDFVDIKYKTSKKDSSIINVYINLRAGKLNQFTIEPQALTSDEPDIINRSKTYRNYGIANTITWTGKNIFKNAEQLDISATTLLQAQGRDTGKFFNSFNQSVSANLFLPKFDWLESFFMERHDYGNIKTSISASYIYEDNQDFTRNILPAKFTLQLPKKKHVYYFTPIEVSYSNSKVEGRVLDNLSPNDRAFFNRLFSANIVTNSNLAWIYNGRAGRKDNYWYLRSNIIETGGFTHHTVRSLLEWDWSADKRIFDLHYYQYLKSDIDARYNWIIDDNNAVVFRTFTGVGYPYGNSNVLPLEKRFFVGGANGLRGWRPREIGPGGYAPNSAITQLERTGEMMIQGNIEYRFQVIKKYVESTLFVDFGNVWNVSRTDQTTKGYFVLSDFRFLDDLALNMGTGLRFDFQFFMVRLDLGMRLKDPSIEPSKAWVIADNFFGLNWFNKYSVLNLGIGYPF